MIKAILVSGASITANVFSRFSVRLPPPSFEANSEGLGAPKLRVLLFHSINSFARSQSFPCRMVHSALSFMFTGEQEEHDPTSLASLWNEIRFQFSSNKWHGHLPF